MTHDHQEIQSALPAAESGLSRRGLLRTAGGIGIAGAAAGMFIGTTGGMASAATPSTTTASDASAQASTPLVAHVHDARTGLVDLYSGEQQVRVHNPALARALAQAASSGQ
jgi:hypothetical protein